MTDYTPAQTKALDLFSSCLKRADKARDALEKATTESTEASAELTWVAAHPALAGIDLNTIVEQLRSGNAVGEAKDDEKTPDAKTDEAPKAKRTRRTKAQIEADNAAKAAAEAGTTVESVADAAEVSGALAAAPDEDDTFSEATVEAPAGRHAAPAAQPAAVTNPFAQGAPAAAPAAGGIANPFAQS